jgi:hypothetical protein
MIKLAETADYISDPTSERKRRKLWILIADMLYYRCGVRLVREDTINDIMKGGRTKATLEETMEEWDSLNEEKRLAIERIHVGAISGKVHRSYRTNLVYIFSTYRIPRSLQVTR